jgi:hypothetical protein
VTAKLSVGVFILALAPAIVAAQSTVRLDSDDVYFTSQITKKALPTRGSESMSYAPTRLCGFQIRGNHRSRANPRVEWDMNIDQIESDAGPIAGVTAGAFDVVGRERRARPPIVDLEFSIEGNPQAIPARIVGTPNASNGIKAVLETESANQLFSAFSDDTHTITIALKYLDNSSDVLEIRGWRGWREFGNGRNSLFKECLRGYTPVRGTLRPVP